MIGVLKEQMCFKYINTYIIFLNFLLNLWEHIQLHECSVNLKEIVFMLSWQYCIQIFKTTFTGLQ